MAYGDFKDLARITASDKVLRDKTFDIAKNSKFDGYQGGLASMVYNFSDKKLKGSAVANNGTKQNQRPLDLAALQLAKELHKTIIRISLKKNNLFRI